MATPAKTSGPTPDDIMAPAAMKPLLALSKREPVSAAIGLTSDKMGVVLLHKKTKPKKLLSELKAEAKKLKLNVETASLRFGMAEVDPEIDSALVRFRINKEAPGMLAPKLRDHLKKAGFSKVEIVVDETLEEESEDETAATEIGSAPEKAVEDWPALGATLTALVHRIAAVSAGNPGRQQSLVKLATAAGASVKSRQDFAAAGGAVEGLRKALEGAGPEGQAPSKTGTVAYTKSRLAWLAARNKVESDIGKLRVEIIETFKDDGIAAQLEQGYRQLVAPVLNAFDEELADKLDDATNATDPSQRSNLVAEAKKAMERYAAFLNADTTITELDANPFLPLTIKTTIGTTLAALEKALA